MKFLLDKPKSDKPTFILLIGTLPEGRFIYSTKLKVHKTHWEGQRCKNAKGFNYDDNNERLNNIDNLIKELRREGQLTKDRLTSELDTITGKRRRIAGVWEVIDHIISDREFGRVVKPNGKEFSALTIKSLKHSKENLQKFDSNLSFADFSEAKYKKLIEYMNGKNYSINTIGKTIKDLKVFMGAAYDLGYHKNPVFKARWFKKITEDTFDVYINEDELKNIAKIKVSGREQVARDWFIVGCFTGLRISDLTLLTKQNLIDNFITIGNEKTDAKVVLPVHPLVKAILKRYKGFPPKVSDQEINRTIKKVAKEAGLTQLFLYQITKGGKRVDEYIPKWKMVSSHSCRRSFITNLLRNGVQDNIVMDLAGIKKHATLLKYKKSTPEETARDIASHSFFAGK